MQCQQGINRQQHDVVVPQKTEGGLMLARAIALLFKPFLATLELRSVDGALRKREAVIVKGNNGYGSEVL